MSDYNLSIQIGIFMKNKSEFQVIITALFSTIMSIDEAEISRRNILRLVRKSASTDYNSESLQGAADDFPEHRIKFLECRKQFEEPPPPVDEKPPFLPHWIKPEYDTDLSITYKRKGAEITDLRINYVDNDGNINEIGSQRELNETDVRELEPKASENPNQESINNGRGNRAGQFYSQNVNVNFLANEKEANSVVTTAADEKLLGISEDRSKRPMDRNSKSTKSIRKFQSLRIIEERSSSMSSKTISTLESYRTSDTPRKNQSSITNYSMPRKLIVCRPIVRRPIELKKYDHIVSNIINTEK